MSAVVSTTPAPAQSQSQTPTIEDVWRELPPFFQRDRNPAIAALLDSCGPEKATATYAHLFWANDADGRPYRCIPAARLLALMMALYEHKGGQDAAGEEAFWRRILRVEVTA